MMLHEAVMLEIYRQALNASELASPRCQSRESNASASANNDARCPSNESHYSGHEGHTPGQTPTPTSPPVGLPLPATLAPAAAAALLPPQSAAMAAYFNAAAAAAQQNHLLLTNPLAAAASLVQQATQQVAHSPNSQQTLTPTPPNASDSADTSALDFSTKRSRRNSDDDANGSEDDEDGADGERIDNEADNANDNEADDVNSPLDLSVNNGRKRQSDEEEPVIISNRKLARSNDYKSLPASSTWVPPINPYLAAVAAANMSPKTPLSMDWNAKTKIAPNEATKALEKMTEMTRLGGSSKADHSDHNNTTRHSTSTTSTSSTTTTTSNGRHSAWQSHWLNKGADAVKDVFKCVWCKQSFATLASLTTHMKETQHCGVNVPPSISSNSTPANSGGNQTTQSSHHSRHSTTQSSATALAQAAALTTNNSATSGGSKSDLNMLIKETMPLPRKLVRGQDVWLGKGAEQTRQILKCMWCGQSFRSLAEMTSHMQETQHYTNIISQEQIISWKSTDEKTSRDNSTSSSSNNRASANSAANNTGNNNATVTVNNSDLSPNASATNANSTVSAVLTCKVCDQAFSTLKELSNHMVKNNHYKEHMIRTAAAAENVPTMIRGRGRQAREKRKKSLPVRKLLEMERAQHDFKAAGLDQALKPLRDFAVSTKLTCETCGEKVETAVFVDHIRQCIDRSLVLSPRSQNNNNNIMKSPFGPSTPQERLNSPQTPHSRSDGRKTSEGNSSPLSSTNTRADILCPLPQTESEKSAGGTSVLNALEQLIEKSFDSRPRQSSAYGDASAGGTPLGSSILKRLGIDDNVDYTKPLMDPQTMQFLRSYSNYPSNRDRSASESSSVSERCSSRLESFTPERSYDLSRQPTPRLTPDRNYQNLKECRDNMFNTKIKSEPIDCSDHVHDADNIPINEIPKKISVKKEFNIPDDHEDLEGHKMKEIDMRHSSLTPSSRAISPSISERSITPKSSCSSSEKKPNLGLNESSSLNALSSMFNNLNNMHSNTISAAATMETNNNNNSNCNTVAKKTNANPLAALQKLCETTDTPAANTRSSSNNSNNNFPAHTTSSSSASNAGGTGGGGGSGSNASMLAFSWACNDAVVTADSIIKCSFCDTPFSSKGAYRHHLSKVHFVKDDQHQQHDMNNMKSPAAMAAISPKSLHSPKSMTSSKSPAAQQRLETTPPSSVATTPNINPYDESPQSKFLKYTELAKQLSSKNA
ncbi:protein tiptop [Calliphora vicina]|uniref:protein tiptop n=1 Tax=Calliphora vicina TaxID=7373 RepID=UPI00325A9E93